MIFKFLFTLFVTSILSLSYASQLIIEPEMGREPILNAINNSQHSIHLVMYGFTDEEILNTLTKQNAAGKNIAIILEKKPYKTEQENVKTINKLNKSNVQWMGGAPAYRLTHQKTLILDDKQAIIMTFNFTKSTFKKHKQRNLALIIDDEDDIREIKDHFNADWQRKYTRSTSSHLIWSPDNSREKIINLIHQAKQEIDIYAQNISDNEIIKALIDAANRGVNINIITSIKLKVSHPHIHIHHSKHLYIHAKAMIIDHKNVMLGSINFTRASLDDNRELSVLTEESTIVNALNALFAKDATLNSNDK